MSNGNTYRLVWEMVLLERSRDCLVESIADDVTNLGVVVRCLHHDVHTLFVYMVAALEAR